MHGPNPSRFTVYSMWVMLLSVLILTVGQYTRSGTNASTGPVDADLIHSRVGTEVGSPVADRIRSAMPGTKIESIVYTRIPGLYQIRLGKNILYTDQSGNYLIIGHLYDMKRRIDLTQRAKQRLIGAVTARRIPWSSLPLQAAIRYGRPGGRKIAIFHDPDCVYCMRLKKELSTTSRFDVYQIMYPIVSLHPEAYKKSKKIFCEYKKKTGRPGQSKADRSCNAEKVLKQAAAFARRHGINGTPVIVTEKGKVILGYRSPEQLAKLIE